MRVVLVILFVCVLAGNAFAERRVALVLGFDSYENIRPLDNAVNDALAIREVLETLNFDVFVETNRDLKRMRRALDDFVEDAAGAEVALVFFAGHSVEIAGENRLLPTDANAASLEALKSSSLPLEELRQTIANAAKISLIVLDACRNDPFAALSDPEGRGATALMLPKIIKPGLGRVGRAENTLFAFSAAPGETASDGDGDNSPFTTALTKYLGTEGLEIRSVLTLVQQEVYERSGGKQLPYIESGLPTLFFATATSQELPERERLLLAMAEVTPNIRDQVERIATDAGMPLAPLYGALIGSDLGSQNWETRQSKLEEAANAFVKVRDELRTLRSDDERVTALRMEAEEQLTLGAFETARAKLTEAANIDATSRQTLKANLIERTLSEAATHYLNGSAARAELKYQIAVDDLERAAALFDELSPTDMTTDDQQQQILALEVLGDIWVIVGKLENAENAFKKHLNSAKYLARADPTNLVWQRNLSISHQRIGDLRRAQGDLTGALGAYTAGLDISERLVASDPANAGWQRDLSVNHDRIGDIRKTRGDLAGALEAYQIGLEILERLSASNPSDIERQRDVSFFHVQIGDIFNAQGFTEDALHAYQAGLEIRKRVSASNPSNFEWKSELSVSFAKFGDAHRAQGDVASALDAYLAGLKISKSIAAANPENAFWQSDLSSIYSRIGDMRMDHGDPVGALEAYQAGIKIKEHLITIDPTNTRWQRDYSILHQRVGDLRKAQGYLTHALSAYEAGLELTKKLTTTDPSNTEWQRDLTLTHQRIGDVRRAQGDLAGAMGAYLAGLDISERLAVTDGTNAEWQRDVSVIYEKIGYLFFAQGSFADALVAHEYSREILKILTAFDPTNTGWQSDLSVNYLSIGDVRWAQGDLDGALEAYTASRDISESIATADPANLRWQRNLSVSYLSIGGLREVKGDLDGALDAYKVSLEISERLAEADSNNAEWQRDLIIAHVKMANINSEPKLNYAKALKIAENLSNKGKLMPRDKWMVDDLRQRLAEAEAVE